jgi:hypothetical protein
MNNPLDAKSFLKALDNFEAKHVSKKGAKAAAVDICGTYKLVKPVLAGLLPFLAFIPGVGPRIVAPIKALMAGLDAFCPTA